MVGSGSLKRQELKETFLFLIFFTNTNERNEFLGTRKEALCQQQFEKTSSAVYSTVMRLFWPLENNFFLKKKNQEAQTGSSELQRKLTLVRRKEHKPSSLSEKQLNLPRKSQKLSESGYFEEYGKITRPPTKSKKQLENCEENLGNFLENMKNVCYRHRNETFASLTDVQKNRGVRLIKALKRISI